MTRWLIVVAAGLAGCGRCLMLFIVPLPLSVPADLPPGEVSVELVVRDTVVAACTIVDPDEESEVWPACYVDGDPRGRVVDLPEQGYPADAKRRMTAEATWSVDGVPVLVQTGTWGLVGRADPFETCGPPPGREFEVETEEVVGS
jgi:hypothetical protein